MQNAKCKISKRKIKMQNAKLASAECKMHNSKCKMQNSKFKINFEFQIMLQFKIEILATAIVLL